MEYLAKNRMVMFTALILTCISCQSPARQSYSQQAGDFPTGVCLFSLRSSAISPSGSIRLTDLLENILDSQDGIYIKNIDLESLRTFVIAVPGACEDYKARKLAHSVDMALKQYDLPYIREDGVAEPTQPSHSKQPLSTLPELLSAASNGQAQLKNCTFVFDFSRAASTSVEQEQAFRTKLENTRKYGVPLLYSFILDEKLTLIFYDQCQSGLKAMEFMQAVLGPLAAQRLSNPRLASTQELQRLLKEAGGGEGQSGTEG